MTTPGELGAISSKAVNGVEPYASAKMSIENFANTGSSAVQPSYPDPHYWPHESISGVQDCSRTLEPSYIGDGSPLVEAKALVYGLLLPTNPHLANQYAEDVRTRILDLTDTSGYGGNVYSGANQCILNLSWYMPGWIIAADLIEGYSGWSLGDKEQFQKWLATVVYKKVDWASDVRSSNWGSAGSATSAYIADYLTGSGILMVDRNGATITSRDAFLEAKKRQLDRMDGNLYMDNYGCPPTDTGQGFRPDGGIPWELGRGSTGCDGAWLRAEDGSWVYMMTHTQGTILHAELLLRRGDPSIYQNVTSAGAGSLLRVINFVIHNPNDPARSVRWKESAKQQLELAYRYYRDDHIAAQLRTGKADRYIGGRSGQMLHFGTITHGFAADEKPGVPPSVAPP